MADDEVTGGNGRVSCVIDVATAENDVDAGGEITLKGRVACSDNSEKLGAKIQILDQDSALVASLELIDFDGEGNETNEVKVSAPLTPGEYNWSALLTANELEGIVYEEARTTFSFVVQPHASRIEVWDVPPAISMGEEFRVKVGIKCSAGCDQTGREFEIFDSDDRKLASGTVGDEPWQGTAALYFTEVVLSAPEEIGAFRWEVRSRESEKGLPHAPGVRVFGSNLVGRPEYVVTVEVFDLKKQAPIKGMHILLHPYRARTDADGVAKLAVPKGDYSLLVSGFRYLPHRTSIRVSEDVSVKAEVEWEEAQEKISG